MVSPADTRGDAAAARPEGTSGCGVVRAAGSGLRVRQADATMRPAVWVRARVKRSAASAQLTMFHQALM